MHMLRLLVTGTHLVRHGDLRVDVGDLRDRLLAVRRGEVPWDEIETWRTSLTVDLAGALDHSPSHPTPTGRRSRTS